MPGETKMTLDTPTKPAGPPIKNSQLFGLLNDIDINDTIVNAIANSEESKIDLDPIEVTSRAEEYIANNLKELNYRGIRFEKGEKSDKTKPNQVFVKVIFDHNKWSDSSVESVNTYNNAVKDQAEQMYSSLKTKIVLLCRDLAKKVITGEENHFRLYAAYVVWKDLKQKVGGVDDNDGGFDEDFDNGDFGGGDLEERVDCVKLLSILDKLKQETDIDVTNNPERFSDLLVIIKKRAEEQTAEELEGLYRKLPRLRF